MKNFKNLIEEVITPRHCHRCGGCVAFCTAIQFNALELDADGKPHFKDEQKCTECGLCYEICPESDGIREETKRRVGWTAPMGRVVDIAMARARDTVIVRNARDGGVVTALLLHLFDHGRIDGALVTRLVGPFTCQPWLALTRREIIEAGGFHFDAAAGVPLVGLRYAAYPPYLELMAPLAKKGLNRIAFVGRPCQIETMRRMETLGVVPSDAIKYYVGLFCMGNFRFGEKEQAAIEKIGSFKWEDVRKVNFKEGLQIHFKNNELKTIDFATLDYIKRYACRFCGDYAAEFADIACGGIGAIEGWTSVIIHTQVGKTIFTDTAEERLELFDDQRDREFLPRMLGKVRDMSSTKKSRARQFRESVGNQRHNEKQEARG